MHEIPLSGRNPDGLTALVDDEDFELASTYRWYAHRAKRSLTVYAKASSGRDTVYLHRLILDAGKGHTIDHIDGNGLNCLRVNLRFVTPSENVVSGMRRRRTEAARRDYDAWESRL